MAKELITITDSVYRMECISVDRYVKYDDYTLVAFNNIIKNSYCYFILVFRINMSLCYDSVQLTKSL